MRDELVPLQISGRLESLYNRTTDGWIVTLVNNEGITKTYNEPPRIDGAPQMAAIRYTGPGRVRAACLCTPEGDELLDPSRHPPRHPARRSAGRPANLTLGQPVTSGESGYTKRSAGDPLPAAFAHTRGGLNYRGLFPLLTRCDRGPVALRRGEFRERRTTSMPRR